MPRWTGTPPAQRQRPSSPLISFSEIHGCRLGDTHGREGARHGDSSTGRHRYETQATASRPLGRARTVGRQSAADGPLGPGGRGQERALRRLPGQRRARACQELREARPRHTGGRRCDSRRNTRHAEALRHRPQGRLEHGQRRRLVAVARGRLDLAPAGASGRSRPPELRLQAFRPAAGRRTEYRLDHGAEQGRPLHRRAHAAARPAVDAGGAGRRGPAAPARARLGPGGGGAGIRFGQPGLPCLWRPVQGLQVGRVQHRRRLPLDQRPLEPAAAFGRRLDPQRHRHLHRFARQQHRRQSAHAVRHGDPLRCRQ